MKIQRPVYLLFCCCITIIIMGKLRTILEQFIKFTPDPKHTPSTICTHKYLPEKQQFTKLITHAVDHCRTCEDKMCLVCSQIHVQQHCTLNLNVNKEIGDGRLQDFNLGYLMKLPLAGLKCICGKPLGHSKDDAICAACGLASCSVSCHKEWQNKGNCTYHLNYYEKPQEINMRSILFQNIFNIQNAKISEWNIANKSSLSYIACFARSGFDYVYLQRGYRNYGTPQPELLGAMEKVEFGLDYTTHIQRVCQCKCEICIDRSHHSVGNCEFSCLQIQQFNSLLFREDLKNHYECSCNCNFCKSGIVVNRHTRLDCMLHCYKSDYNVDKLE